MSERAFLDAIVAEPDADVHRLVFADWLDENGQEARAEFIRAQVALATMSELDPRRAELEERERRLLAANAPEWADPCPRWAGDEYAGQGPWRAEFRRGFVEAVDIVNGSLFGAHPIREVNFDDLSAGTLELLGKEEWRRVEALGIIHRGAATEIDRFLRSADLPRLRRLFISSTDSGGARATGWLEVPAVARLEALHLARGLVPDGRFLRGLATGPFPALHEVTLPLSDRADYLDAANGLVHSALWPRLRTLRVPVSRNFPWSTAFANGRPTNLIADAIYRQPTDAFLAALESSPAPPTIQELDVNGDLCHGEALSRVLAAPALACLRRLHLRHTYLSDDDLERLARSPLLANLSRLTVLLRHDVGASAQAALLGSPGLGRLTHLEINGAPIRGQAAEALARNPARSRLRVVRLEIGSAAAFAGLTAGEPFLDLHTLRLAWWRPSPPAEAFGPLLRSPTLPRLCVLEYDGDAEDAHWLAPLLRSCERLAWAGGEMTDGGDGVRVAIKPEGVYLPNHLADG